jgi:hypothetical protein
LDFFFISPSPAVSPTHSYVKVIAAYSPGERVKLTSKQDGDKVILTAENAIRLELDGAALAEKGIATVVVNAKSYEVTGETMFHGSETGKSPEAYGPLVQVFYRPFCVAYGEDKEDWRSYAAYLVSTWNIIGNGHGCMLPAADVTEELRADRNIIYVGVAAEDVPFPDTMPIDWSAESVSVSDAASGDAMLSFVFPSSDRLGAVFTATEGSEHLLYRLQPFNSRFWIPDFLILATDGLVTTGFFDADWEYSAALKAP